MKLNVRLNKKFTKFDNKDWLKQERLIKDMSTIAREQECSHGTVRWACRIFTDQENADFKWKRKQHKNFKL